MAWYLSQTLERIQADEANNRSLYRTRVYLNWNQYQTYSGYSTSGGGSVAGQAFSFTGPSSGGSTSAGSQQIHVQDFWVSHDSNGYLGTVGADSWFNGGGGYAPGYITASASAGGADYNRAPSAPSFSAITRNIDDYTVSLNGVSSPAGTPTYYIQRSQNGGAWGDDRASQSTTYADLPKGSTQQFRAAAYNSDGWSGWTYSAVYTVPNVPDLPSSTTVTLAPGRMATVTSGTPSSNGGSAITAYYAQASSDNGVTWQTAQLMTAQSFTFTGLIAGATYKFRTYAVNEMGQSLYSTSASTKIPAGLKIKDSGGNIDALAVKVKIAANTWVDVDALKIKTTSGYIEAV